MLDQQVEYLKIRRIMVMFEIKLLCCLICMRFRMISLGLLRLCRILLGGLLGLGLGFGGTGGVGLGVVCIVIGSGIFMIR